VKTTYIEVDYAGDDEKLCVGEGTVWARGG
jgi:hypothetical protein